MAAKITLNNGIENTIKSFIKESEKIIRLKNINMKSIALIIGIICPYLAKHLIKNGYEVYGSSRDKFTCDKSKLINLGISKKVKLISIAPMTLEVL